MEKVTAKGREIRGKWSTGEVNIGFRIPFNYTRENRGRLQLATGSDAGLKLPSFDMFKLNMKQSSNWMGNRTF